jgi:GNAT superfamily N-acetyltransferase
MQVDLVAPARHDSLVELLCELHAHYHEGASMPPATVRSHLVENLLGPESPLRLVVAAREDGRVVGLAAISLTWSLVDFAPEQRRHCQLKELYVRASDRSGGVGRALMAWVSRYAVGHGCHRIDWPVKAGNARGIAFYERLGARRVVERLGYRLTEPAVGALAEAREGAGRPG